MKTLTIVMTAAFAVNLALARPARAQAAHDEKAEKHEEHEDAGKVTGETLENVKVSLARGLAAAAKTGQPLSAKFEKDEGKLQLSVYTAKDGKFSEVIVDHKSGKVAKTEAITGGDDLAAAQAQSAALGKAKTSLAAAVKKALAANKGFTAIGAVPSVKDGHPVADVTLGMEDDLKTVSIKLD